MTSDDEYDDRVVTHNGKTWVTDYEGYLIHFDPDEDWYDYVRTKAGLPTLTPEHRTVIEFYQNFYRNNGIYPFRGILARELGKINQSIDSICKLFPSEDPLKTIHLMAGLPGPWGYK